MESNGPLRMWSADDYPLLETWWKGHGWPPVPQRVLPPLGVIYRDTAAGWLYMDNGGTGVAMLEWLVTDPSAKPIASVKALSVVVEFLKARAKEMDYAFVLTTCRQPALARLLERSGFQITDREMIHLMGVLA